jgi:predicted GNAT family N-acyltransferase
VSFLIRLGPLQTNKASDANGYPSLQSIDRLSKEMEQSAFQRRVPSSFPKTLLPLGSWTLQTKPMNLYNSTTNISIADSDEAMRCIYRLRYEIYIEEQQHKFAEADHNARHFQDRHDDSAIHLCSWRDKSLLACIRFHLGHIPSELAVPLHLERFPNLNLQRCAYASRLIVRKDARGTRSAYALMRRGRDFLKAKGMDTLFCTAFPKLVSFYAHLGLVPYTGPFLDPQLGIGIAIAGSLHSVEMNRLLRSRRPTVAGNSEV